MLLAKMHTHARAGLKIASSARSASHKTHEILNQSKSFLNVDIYDADPSIKRCVSAFTKMDASIVEMLHRHGKL